MYCFWENYIVRTDLQQLFRLFSSSFTHIIAWKEIYSEPKLYLEYMSFLAFCSLSLSPMMFPVGSLLIVYSK